MVETVIEDPRAWRERLVARAAARLEVWHRDGGAARAAAEEAVDDLLDDSELHRIGVAGREQGWCWLGPRGRDLQVRDLELGSPAVVAEVRDWLCEHARDSGLVGVRVSSRPELPVTGALVADPRFVVFATNMCLELAGAPATSLRLEPMSEPAYADYAERSTREYTADRHAAGEPLDEARRVAEEQMVELLPHGLATPEQHLFTAFDDGADIGLLWLSTSSAVPFVYDVEVREEHRGRGLGRSLMDAAAAWCVERGAPALGLNVFGHNTRARALYDSLGYRVVEDACRADLG